MHIFRLEAGKADLNETIDVRLAIRYEDLVNKLEHQIQDIANEYVDFWGILEGVTPDLNLLHSKGVEIMRQNIQIDELWSEITSIDSTNKRTNSLYGKYAKELKNDKQEAEALLEGTQGYEPRATERNAGVAKESIMFADDTGLIIANSVGIILRHNVGVTKLFSYNSQELIGQNVQILMPHIIGKDHAKLVDMSVESGNVGKLHQIHKTIALHRFGNIFLIALLVKPVPSLKEGTQFISFIKKDDRENYLVLTDEHGRMEGLSGNFGELLGITPQLLKAREIYMQLFFQQLADLVTKPSTITVTSDKLSFLDTLNQENSTEGVAVELDLMVTKTIRETITKLQVKEQRDNEEISYKTAYEAVEVYAQRIRQITNYQSPMETNPIAKVLLYDKPEIDKVLKGYQWFYTYGNGMVKLRVFQLKISKGGHCKKKVKNPHCPK